MNDLKFNLGDIGYIVRYHMKDKMNIGYYVDKVRICDFDAGLSRKGYYYVDHSFEDNNTLPCKTGRRIYLAGRVFKTLEEAQKERDFKNKELNLRNDYKDKLRELRECP